MKDTRVSEYQEKEIKNFFVKEDINNICEKKYAAGFERLWVWQKAYELMQEILKFCKTLPKDERFKTRDQIERSSNSPRMD